MNLDVILAAVHEQTPHGYTYGALVGSVQALRVDHRAMPGFTTAVRSIGRALLDGRSTAPAVLSAETHLGWMALDRQILGAKAMREHLAALRTAGAA